MKLKSVIWMRAALILGWILAATGIVAGQSKFERHFVLGCQLDSSPESSKVPTRLASGPTSPLRSQPIAGPRSIPWECTLDYLRCNAAASLEVASSWARELNAIHRFPSEAIRSADDWWEWSSISWNSRNRPGAAHWGPTAIGEVDEYWSYYGACDRWGVRFRDLDWQIAENAAGQGAPAVVRGTLTSFDPVGKLWVAGIAGLRSIGNSGGVQKLGPALKGGLVQIGILAGQGVRSIPSVHALDMSTWGAAQGEVWQGGEETVAPAE